MEGDPKMRIESVGRNTVIVANQFNASILNQLWLVRNNILDEDDFEPGCLFTEALIQVRSRQFNLLVGPPQLNFEPKGTSEAEAQLILDKVGAIVRMLPHTPYTGVGLNFVWHVSPDDGDVAALSRELFFRLDGPLCGPFDSPDARFGGYFSKDVLGVRLKLDIKPVTGIDNGQREFLRFAFNFHRDLGPEEPVERILDALRQWGPAKDQAQRILDRLPQ